MKKLLLTTLILSAIFVSAQPFEKTYPYLTNVFTDDVEVNGNGFTLAGFGYVLNRVRLVLIHTNAIGDTLNVEYPDAVIPGTGTPNGLMITAGDGFHYVAVPNGETANLIKYSPAWTELWRIKNDSINRIQTFCETSDGNLLMSVITDKPYLTRIDTSGHILWQSEIPDGWLNPSTNSIVETNNEEILLGMYYPSSYPGGVTWNNTFYTFSSSGTLLGSATLSPDEGESCSAEITIPMEDYFVSICSFEALKPRLVNHQADGTILSQKEISLPFTSFRFQKMILNNKNELVAIGFGVNNPYSNSSIIYGMSAEGDSLWLNTRQYEQQFVMSNIALCPDGGYVVSGAYVNPDTDIYYPMLIKTDPWGGNSPLSIQILSAKSGFIVYPNPAVDRVVFESIEPLYEIISITDMSGRKIANIPTTGLKTVWNVAGLKPGVYFYKIENKGDIPTGKLIIGL